MTDVIETLAVIPARYGSTRLPGKPLLKLAGKELILWVWEGVKQSSSVNRVIVATDYEPIANLIQKSGGEAMMTPTDLPTGNDRVAYVAERIPSRFVLNIQGDDPMVTPTMINPMIETLQRNPDIHLVVLAKRIEHSEEVARNSIVKMVFDERGHALYFSRSPIPFSDDPTTMRFKHVGPYAWRRGALFEFASTSQTPLEKAERLEMLRILEKGGVIRCVKTDIDTIEIDTPEDVFLFERFISKKQ